MLSWRVLNQTSSTKVTVEILQRHAWRYDYYTPNCTGLTILSGLPLLGSGNIVCISTCPTGLSTLGSVQAPCTGYSISEQYAASEGRFTFVTKINSSFVATFTGMGWFQLVVSANAIWSVAVQVQTYKRSNGLYNNAPIVTMLPIYRLLNLKTYTIQINVADNDFDYYLCLWSNGTTECGNLTNNVPSATINQTACYITFTPQIIGYYAVAVTVMDYETSTSSLSAYLSQVPIQFVFHVYNSSSSCWMGPVYVGDLLADTCIYLIANTTFTTRIRLQIQCAGANLTDIIAVNPVGLTTSSFVPDPTDPTIFIYFVYFSASSSQYGQNLYCFAGIDSIGNQGTSACLRFIVESTSVLINTLYTQNATRYPMGTVASTTSKWTILTPNVTYIRPTTEAYIRFKRLSDNTDVYRLNVLTETTNVLYLAGSLVITSNVIWTPGIYYYIYFDAGVLSLASTCTKPSMPIIDPTFWPFNIPYETTSTTTTSTSTTSISSTLRQRTVPTLRTLVTYSTTTLTTSITSALSTESLTSIIPFSTTTPSSPLTVSVITIITLAVIISVVILSKILITLLRGFLIRLLLVRHGLQKQLYSFRSVPSFISSQNDRFSSSTSQYKLATNRRAEKYRSDKSNRNDSNVSAATITTLVEVNI